MGQDTPHSFRLAEAEMSLLDKRAVILAYQSYQLEMCNIPQEVFGEEMDFYLDWAVCDGDQMLILSKCLHDVLEALQEISGQQADEWPVLRDSLAAALPEDVFGIVMRSIRQG